MYSNRYKILKKQIFNLEDYSIVPIRKEDKYLIMKWRNDQIYHLRQSKLLQKEDQDYYFKNTIANLFNQKNPTQILFSFLKKKECIGYGGLVHINWVDLNAEISFIMNTSLEKRYFSENWSKYLNLIEQVAFNEIKLKKIFIYAFDLRPNLYEVLTENKYFLDARLKSHCYFKDKFIDVLIYSKII